MLPIAMTLINIIAGAIYTKGFSFKEKAQIYGMALVFLVILYNSPSGLVLYWTMNNVFSLIKKYFLQTQESAQSFLHFLLYGSYALYSLSSHKKIRQNHDFYPASHGNFSQIFLHHTFRIKRKPYPCFLQVLFRLRFYVES